ncbi:MAG: TonB-dependent receptor [Methylophilaceae bacterium]|nr:MAG: TonB-dependent receptor [Methylophilaceae bacterium]
MQVKKGKTAKTKPALKLSVLMLAMASIPLGFAADADDLNKTGASTSKPTKLGDIGETEFLEVIGQAAQIDKALKDQRASDSIESVVRADAIGQLPDDNAAEALQRVPGVSIERDQGEGRFVTIRGLGPDLNSVNINGVNLPSSEPGGRAVALDVLPSELIQSLSVVKTLTPDMDANSLGATVNVNSLSGFDHDGFFYTISGEAGFNPLVSKTSPKVSGAISNIFSVGDGTDNLAVALALSFQQRKFGSDNVETGGEWDGPELNELQARDYQIQRDRLGVGLNIDYKPDALSNYYLRTIYSKFKDDEQRHLAELKFDDAQLPSELGAADGSRELKDRIDTQEIKSITFGGEKNIGLWTIDGQASYSESSEKSPFGIAGAVFEGAFANTGFSNTRKPRLIAGADYFNPNSFELDEVEAETTDFVSKQRDIKMDFARLYDFKGYDSQVKFGAKAIRRDVRNDTQTYIYDDFGTLPTNLSQYSGGNLNYKPGPFGQSINGSAIRNLIGQLDRNAALDEEESRINDYQMTEDINAAYVMNTIDINKLRLIAGLRYEGTKFTAKGTSVVDGSFAAVSKSNDYHNVLPGLHAKYQLAENTLFRAAYTNTVVRPTFDQLAPGVVINGDEAAFGNPDLNPLEARNLDIGIEHYMGRAGVLSAFAFYKDIKNFVYETDVRGTGAWTAFDEALTFENGDDAKVYGLELAYSQKLDWLSYPWNKVILGANATFSDSTAKISSLGQTRNIVLPSQSKQVGNMSIGWQDQKFSVRLAGNYKSKFLAEVGAIDTKQNDLYADAQLYVDLSASYFITPKMQLTFDAQNITDEKFYVYQNRQSFNSQFEEYGPTYRVSLTFTDF